ncbi:Phosphatidate cytidylyltransferase [Nosema granulosis]|uniref:Phosphatidate cytidylyltransferase n=1 Tax=Nosema granulosis TaxID=83296 RepID=A0A9P6KZU0_9MICR|nr:Phosphatidate cytidylyltransferase [Nosema granulosis]
MKKKYSPGTSKDMQPVIQTNIFKRSLLSIVMIGAFSYLISLNHIYLCIFVILLGILVNKEIIGIAKIGSSYPSNKLVVAGLSALIFTYYIADSLVYCVPLLSKWTPYLNSVFFYAYIALFMLFVCGLTKGKLKSQFAVFALSHLASYFCAISSKAGVRNISNGKFWLVFPSSLVICNDIMAYIVGKAMGRTPLFKLSPKKTVEGFIGGFVGTAVLGGVFCYVHLNYNILSDTYSQELAKEYSLGWFTVRRLYIHCIPFVLVASFIAPFSGFLASALKRAYKKKDFGQSIPGHGGLADRFDCQVIIALFTNVYIRSFLRTKTQSLFCIYSYITNNLNQEEIKVLISLLRKYLTEDA